MRILHHSIGSLQECASRRACVCQINGPYQVSCTAGYMQWRGMIPPHDRVRSLREQVVALIQSLATNVNVCPDGSNSTLRLVAVGSAADGCWGNNCIGAVVVFDGSAGLHSVWLGYQCAINDSYRTLIGCCTMRTRLRVSPCSHIATDAGGPTVSHGATVTMKTTHDAVVCPSLQPVPCPPPWCWCKCVRCRRNRRHLSSHPGQLC